MTGISWVQPGFRALSETDGSGDSCGPIAILDYLQVAQDMTLDIPTLKAMRLALIKWGLMNTPGSRGMTLTGMAAALRDHYHVTPLNVEPWSDSFNPEVLRTALRTGLPARHAFIWETHNASALPETQAGVQNHFLLTWGIDSMIGYYTANGDSLHALASGGVVGPVWYSWANIAAAQPKGYIELPAVAVPAAPLPVIPPEYVQDKALVDALKGSPAVVAALKTVGL